MIIINGKFYDEKYIDMTEYNAEYDLRKHLANDWFVDSYGLTIIIIRKEIKI